MRNLGPIDAMKEANKVLKREGPYKNLTDKDIEKLWMILTTIFLEEIYQ
jgi:hypothetical protein